MPTFFRKIQDFLQIQLSPVSHAERIISVTGGFVGIFLVMMISTAFLETVGAAMVVASMGASAVLLFATPHGTLSQPWPLIVSHVVSAAIGVACAKFIPYPIFAAAAAVSLAIGAMHLLRCIHPPGGATALTAVVGGDAIHALGFQFVLTPVLINAVTILLVALVFNFPFSWRRYPVGWSLSSDDDRESAGHYPDISHADFVAALSDLDTFIDVTEEDLLRIYRHVTVPIERPDGQGK